MPTTKVTYNKMKPAANATVSDQAIAHLTNTVSRPGPLTTEWWTVLIATTLSTVLGVVGVRVFLPAHKSPPPLLLSCWPSGTHLSASRPKGCWLRHY